MDSVKYSVIIPVYNSIESLKILTQRLEEVFTNVIKENFEILFVDDGSSNLQTWKILEQLGGEYSFVQSIKLTRNFGKQAALIAGFTLARGQFIITMDDDLQHSPEDIAELIKHEKHHVVIGDFEKKEHSGWKRLLSQLNNKAETLLIGKPKKVTNSPFKLIQRVIIDAVLQIKTPYPSISALLFYTTRDAVNAKVSHSARTFGKSGFTISKMLTVFINMAFHNSAFFLKTIASIGISISLISFAIGIVFIFKKVTVGIPVPGYTSLITIISFLGGLTLFSIGILGEYLIRIIQGVESKPSFVIDKIIIK